ncbi:MAG: enolase C-terminal domain-like protein, partial [Planctomycetota bacterium]
MKIDAITLGADTLTLRADGVEAIVPKHNKLALCEPIFNELVVPFALGRDCADVAGFVDGVYRAHRNYKWAGTAFWIAVAHVELAMWDALGKAAGKPVSALLGEAPRAELPVYLSSMRRDNSAEEEVERLAEKLERTGATALKVKIGGRMSRNADSIPGRTQALVEHARRTLPDATLYVDANGSYDPAHAIEVGRMLEANAVAWFEEPCEWEAFRDTWRVAGVLDIPVAGGEQESRSA